MTYENHFRPAAGAGGGRPEREIDQESSRPGERKRDSSSEAFQAETVNAAVADPEKTTEPRPGDNLVDRPRRVPQAGLLAAARKEKPCSGSDACSRSAGRDAPVAARASQFRLEDYLKRPRPPFRLPRLNSALGLGALFLAALVLLTVYFHAVAILSQLLALPAALRWPGLGLLGLLVGIVFYVLVRALFFAAGLAGGGQLDLAQLEIGGTAAGIPLQLCKLARREFLEPYLKRLVSLKGHRKERFLVLAGEASPVLAAAEELLDRQRHLGSRAWLAEFRENIQQPLEKQAGVIATGYANAAALKTALSPWPLVDMLAVLYNAVCLLADLTLLFNRRLSRFGRLRLFCELMFTLLVAGRAQEAARAVKHCLEGVDGSSIHEAAAGVAGGAGGEGGAHSLIELVFGHFGLSALAAGRFAAPRLAEGAAAWLLLKRFGRSACELLKPLA